jgi:hypothetical protein
MMAVFEGGGRGPGGERRKLFSARKSFLLSPPVPADAMEGACGRNISS